MNTLEEFLSELRQLNIQLWVEGENLRYSAPQGVLTTSLRAQLTARKPELLKFLQQAKATTFTSLTQIQPISRQQELPMSFAQQRLWFLEQLEGASPTYNIPVNLRLRGHLHIALLEKSLMAMIQRHEVLRTTFTVNNGTPCQEIAPHLIVPLQVINLQFLSAAEQSVEWQRLAQEEAERIFDLAKGPLVRFTLLQLASTDFVFLLAIHHIIADGWSIGIFSQELFNLYEALATGTPSPLPPLPIQYADFAYWQRQWLQGEVLETHLNYWQQQLTGAPPLLALPTDQPRPSIQTFNSASHSLVLLQPLTTALRQLSQLAGSTLFMTLLATFKLLLHRHTGQTDIIVGTPIAGRNRAEIEGLIGFFVNTLVLRTDLSGSPSFRTLLTRVREVALGAYAHEDLPFEKLIEKLQPDRDLSHPPLFQVWFNMLNLATPHFELSTLQIEFLTMPEIPSKFDVTMYVLEQNQTLHCKLVYNADLFSSARMLEMLNQYHQLLTQVVAQPENNIAHYSLVTPASQAWLPNPQQPLMSTWEGAVHTHFSYQAQQLPDKIALVEPQAVWRYAKVEARSNQVANYLLNRGIQPQDRIAIYGERSASLVIALLAILKASAAFMILDPAYPPNRLIEYLSKAKPRVWLQLESAGDLPVALEQFVSTLSETESFITLLLSSQGVCKKLNAFEEDEDSEEDATPPPEVTIDPENVAYIAFTTGTTGTAKAIVGTHRPLSHFLHWHCQTFGFSEADRFSMLSGLSHDPLLRDIFTPLWLGATLYIPEPKIERFGQLAQWIQQQQISIVHLTPALGQLLAKTAATTGPLNSLRYLFFGGDILTTTEIDKLRKLAPLTTGVNFYGATETPQAMSYFIIPNQRDLGLGVPPSSEVTITIKENIPVGRGIDNVQLLVLNSAQQLTGIGEVGEICIRTPYLAKGYLDEEELTQARFILNPWSPQVGDRLYRTGDLGRYLPDGNVEFLGRLDNQVKIRGFRIELGEIESVLVQHPDIHEAVVVAREDQPGDKRLVAYIVPHFIPERVPYQSDCLIEIDQKSIMLRTEDISYHGVCLVNPPPTVTPGQHLRLRLWLPGDSEACWLTGKVVWCQTGQRAGIQFELTPSEQTRVHRYIEYFIENKGFLKFLQRAINENLRKYLKERLPDYMVPSAFLVLESLPLTPNGKIDRRQLPAPDQRRPELEETLVAPRNAVEKQLTRLWETVLKIHPIGIHDNFFKLGGHSLLAVTLLNRVEKAFGKNISLMAMFQAPTIAHLASLLGERGIHQPSPALEVIQPRGSRPPFFFIGSTSYARLLAPHLGTQQPVYGLNIFGLQPADSTGISLEVKEIARQYLQEIYQVQTEGPYYIGGYCADAKVAFEMAQQLQYQGQSVAFLAFFDVIWKPQKHHFRHWQNLLKFGFGYLPYKIRQKLKFVNLLLALSWNKLIEKIYRYTDHPAPRKLQDLLFIEAYYKALEEYVPQPYSDRITLFLSHEWFLRHSPELARLTKGGVEIYEVPGYHDNLFEMPQVTVLGEQLQRCLEKAVNSNVARTGLARET